MSVVLPMVAMVFFSALCVGAFAWMRRPDFGETDKSAPRVVVSARETPLRPTGDLPVVAPSPFKESASLEALKGPLAISTNQKRGARD